ncbi:MAG: hypothetical protein BJ554DRAFT_1293, partial [Olpidium bornovanus]
KVATPAGQLIGVPRRLLDARRPYPPLTNEQKEEMLVPYEPALTVDPRMTVSYYLEVLGVRSIISSPALLESTSLVLAHGLDLFHTRLAPSKQFDVLSEDFSKSGLLLTMTACVLGILVARPMVILDIITPLGPPTSYPTSVLDFPTSRCEAKSVLSKATAVAARYRCTRFIGGGPTFWVPLQ